MELKEFVSKTTLTQVRQCHDRNDKGEPSRLLFGYVRRVLRSCCLSCVQVVVTMLVQPLLCVLVDDIKILA